MIDQKSVASWFLRIGLAVPFLYAAINSFMNPEDWIGFLPAWIGNIAPPEFIPFLFSFYETVLALWLLSGLWVRYAAALSALTLFAIILSSPSSFLITFRDIGLIFAALALATAD